jgi:hypothetical protein
MGLSVRDLVCLERLRIAVALREREAAALDGALRAAVKG